MKLFKYKAQDVNGYPCAGTLKAATEEEALRVLAAQGKTEVVLEEDLEDAHKITAGTLSNLDTYRKPKNPLNEFLSYAMPAGAMVIAIAGAAVAFGKIKLPDVKIPADKVIEGFVAHESSGAYENQFSLLSKAMRAGYGSAEAYDRQRKDIRPASEDGFYRFGKVSGVKQVEAGRTRQRYEVRPLRPTGVVSVEFFLVRERGSWKIDAFRDPALVDAYLSLLDQSGDGEKAHKVRVSFKTLTAYSDLDVEALLKAFRKARRNKELGGDSFLAI